jgi:transcriptional regulator with XRE-family HTH domain
MAKQNHKYGYNWYFGQTVAYIRKRRNISQQKLAEKLRVNQSAISRIENGEIAVKVSDLAAFSSELGLLASELHKIVSTAFRLHKSKLDEIDYLNNIATTCDEYID